jgi:hypothetical protein
MPVKSGKKKATAAKTTATKTTSRVAGPLTIEVYGKPTLRNVEKALRQALHRYQTDVFADTMEDTLRITLQHQMGPRPVSPTAKPTGKKP